MISDQGKEFVNNLNKELFQKTGIEHRIASAYHPQVCIHIIYRLYILCLFFVHLIIYTNGLTERMNQTLQRSL